jgi:V/A-type H+-transporting ATPase subunit C
MKFETNCVKALLRAKEADLSVEEAMNNVTPVGSLNEARCRNILETSENIAEVIDSLLDLEFGSVLEKAYTAYNKHEAFYSLEVALDRHVYHKIWGAAGKFWGLDKKIARAVIRLEIDFVNVKTIFRCKAMGIDTNQIKQYLVPASDVLNEERLQDAMNCSDMQSTFDSLVETAKRARARDHRIIFKELQELQVTSLTAVETILDRGLLEANLRMLKRYTPYFNIGLLLAFLSLKWFEVKNLRAILRGAEAGIAPDRIKKLLVIQR